MAEKDLDRSSSRRHRERVVGNEARTPHPGGNADNYQNKRVAGKAIRKTMKTKGEQNVIATEAASLEGSRRRSRSEAWRPTLGYEEDRNSEGGWPTDWTFPSSGRLETLGEPATAWKLDKRSRFIVAVGEGQRNWSKGQKESTCPFSGKASNAKISGRTLKLQKASATTEKLPENVPV